MRVINPKNTIRARFPIKLNKGTDNTALGNSRSGYSSGIFESANRKTGRDNPRNVTDPLTRRIDRLGKAKKNIEKLKHIAYLILSESRIGHHTISLSVSLFSDERPYGNLNGRDHDTFKSRERRERSVSETSVDPRLGRTRLKCVTSHNHRMAMKLYGYGKIIDRPPQAQKPSTTGRRKFRSHQRPAPRLLGPSRATTTHTIPPAEMYTTHGPDGN